MFTEDYPIVLLTGFAGFIGSQLLRDLIKKGYNVVGIDNLSAGSDMKNATDFIGHPQFFHIIQDIGNDMSDTLVHMPGIEYIINCAAQSHVDRSWGEYDRFIRSNITGPLNLAQISLSESFKKTLKVFVQVSCYSSDMRAFTASGMKSYDEIKVGDQVLSVNPDTNAIEWKKVEKVIVQDYKGPMVHFNSRMSDLLVTPNHRMYYRSGGNPEKIKVDEAKKAKNLTNIYLPTGDWTRPHFKTMSVKGVGSFDSSDLMFLIGCYIGDGYCNHQKKKVKLKTQTNRRGQKRYYGIQNSYRVFFYVPEAKKCREELEAVLDRMGLKWSNHRNKTIIYLAGDHTKEWYTFFKQFGIGAINKRISRRFMNHSKENLQRLFDGLVGTDGSYRPGSKVAKCYFTVSEDLKNDVVELMVKLGIQPRVVEKKDSESFIDGRRIHSLNTQYVIHARYGKIGIGKGLNEDTDYDGKIWCLKVQDNRNFLVERNGVFSFCGNTDEVFCADSQPFSEVSSKNPQNIYSSTKFAAEMMLSNMHKAYGLPLVITNGANTYGPRQYEEKIIPKTVKYLMEGKKVPVYKTPAQRMWLHVEDHSSGIIAAMEKGEPGKRYCLAPDLEDELYTHELVQKIAEIMEIEVDDAIEYVEDRPNYDLRYLMQNVYARDKLKWIPENHISDRLEETVHWFTKKFL